MTPLAGTDATGSAKTRGIEEKARAEVDPAIVSRDDLVDLLQQSYPRGLASGRANLLGV